MKMNPNVSLKHKVRLSSSRWLRQIAACSILLPVAALLPQVRGQNQSPLPFYEPFPSTYLNNEYLGSTNGVTGSTSGGVSGAVWDFGNGLSSSCARVQSNAALEYPGLTNIDAISQSLGVASYYKDSGSTKDRGAALVIPANTTLYASCLLNFQNLTNATPQPIFGLSTSSSGSSVGGGAVIYYSRQGVLQVAKNSTTPATNTTYTLATSNTYLVVLRYKFNPGSPDQVDLWIDPTSLGNDATMPPPTFTTTNNANVTSFGSVGYYEQALPTVVFLDEVRVATNWSGVTPTNAPPGNLYAVTGGGAGCAGASFNVGVSGSDSGVSYLLYTNGILTGQSVAGTGSAVGFGLQSATAIYTVLATNTTTANVGWMSGSATVSVTPAPNIAVQPVSALVATNALAGFTVSSSGNGLGYLWYRNGSPLSDGGHVSGSQTTNLVISPATTADAATTANGYYVKVSNPCGGFIYSTTNALVLQAPANLVWYGDGVSNLWDVAVSTNWNYSSGLGYATNVFNFGDNVVFDDTSPNLSVVLANPDLSPSSIVVNSTQAYTFGGSGVLAGNGAIVMENSGSLTLSIQNNETGGLTISNGTVLFSSTAALGSGPITLAGGALSAPGTGLVTVTNAINITGSNSVIGANSPGGQPLVFTAPPNGLGGSLVLKNITSKSGATPNVEFTATGFTFNLPVDLSPGTGGVLLGGFNSSGSQIWNGLLTDAGGVWRNTAGGTTILNNTNTYSGVTKLSNGNLGVGADSISILNPPAIDAGPLGTGTFTIDTGTSSLELFASGGAHVVGNAINFATTNNGAAFVIGGSNNLTLSGTFDLTSSNRVIQTDNTGLTILSGVISDSGAANGLVNGLTKTGAGVLYLDGANTYTGDTTNSAGTLAGSGSLAGRLVVQSGATIGAGDAGSVPGTFTVNSDLLLGGNGWFRLNENQAQSNDLVVVSGMLTNWGAGAITVTNLGPALSVGDTFTLFSEAVSNGAVLNVTGGGMNWSNRLAVDGSIQALSVIPTTASYSTNLTYGSSGNTLNIGWPATHLGWILQSQTNALKVGLTTASNTWIDVSGTGGGTNASMTINPTNPAVFFRLRHP